MAFKKVDPRQNYSEMEEDVLSFWNEQHIFEKSVFQREGKESYSFYDGPPFATGLPHYGHIVASVIKDVVPRYWTMRGRHVSRRWGWDCHGLPIENFVEKEIGSTSKKDIEKMGVAKFNEKCRARVLAFADEWEKIIPRLGRWADMKNAYRTMDKDFMESVWWVFKSLHDKNLVYEDYRSVHICPRCETTLSQSEVAEGYLMVKDLSVTVKFELVDEPGTFVLAWTTTPWTLPGNVALAVGEDVEYVKVHKIDDVSVRFICAKSLSEKLFGDSGFVLDGSFSGSDLVGKKYRPLFDAYSSQEDLENRENGWQIYTADFVTADEGTGIVHVAPAFGEDDMRLSREKSLPFVQHVGMDGVIRGEVGEPFVGLHVKPKDNVQATDIEFLKHLAKNGLLFLKEKYEHTYPHCWRCDTPLLNYAMSSWFVSVTKIKEQLLSCAKDIQWFPKHMKDGRFGKWLEGARDWSVSRQRFWASVIPVWRCDAGCGRQDVFGCVSDLHTASGVLVDDLHKHVVDDVTYSCSLCSGVMRRVPDVLDTWFDSGAMPYAQAHYLGGGGFEKNIPANFIAEGVDQTRAWFYYLHVLSTALFEKPAFQQVVVNGIVVAEDGKKMSKKLQNYPDPMAVVQKYGADPLRFYLLSSPVVSAENLSFSERELSEFSRGMFRMLWQSYSFFVMYASIDEWKPSSGVPKVKHVLDRWVLSLLQNLAGEVNDAMEGYNLSRATRAFVPFVDDLSNWYIRRSRKRFWKNDDEADKNQAYATLHYVLVELSKLMAPFAPFVSEEIFKNLTGKESVHLEDYPETIYSFSSDIFAQMQIVRGIVGVALQLSSEHQRKIRQPLGVLYVVNHKCAKEFDDIFLEEVNVKNFLSVSQEEYQNLFKERSIVWGEFKGFAVGLDLATTPELKREGQAREIIRAVQAGRKKAGFNVEDRIVLCYKGFPDVFGAHKKLIASEVLAEEVLEGVSGDIDYSSETKIDEEVFSFGLRRV
ncbi:MAG: isoleucine--tRNA ligase [Candidatus Moranbacteria bacterium]|nr:isoleucine--tRNA ligase [Candidatus Moranbacteria bacterium]